MASLKLRLEEGWLGPRALPRSHKTQGTEYQSFRTEDQSETFAYQSPWLKERLANHSTDYHKYKSKEKPFTKI